MCGRAQTECDLCVVRWTEAALSEPYWQSVQGERSSDPGVTDRGDARDLRGQGAAVARATATAALMQRGRLRSGFPSGGAKENYTRADLIPGFLSGHKGEDHRA
jgi:hypothetical protein